MEEIVYRRILMMMLKEKTDRNVYLREAPPPLMAAPSRLDTNSKAES